MRFSLPIMRRISESLRKRDWFGIGFELFVVVLGVLLGIQASRWNADREERDYREQILASLDRTMGDYEYEGNRIHQRISASLAAFERATAGGKRPPPPIIQFPGMERPPTRAWEALVETGVARSINPDLMFRLALHFDRADSFGEKYQRYNLFTEREVLPFRDTSAHFYGSDGRLRPSFAGHLALLRDLRDLNVQMRDDARSIRKLLGRNGAAPAPARPPQDLPLEG